MVECLTRDQGAAGSHGLTALCVVLEQDTIIYPSLVLVEPRKTCPCLTERLLMGRKKSNQTKVFSGAISFYMDIVWVTSSADPETLSSMLSTGLIKENIPTYCKIVDWDVKYLLEQSKYIIL